MYSCHVCVCVCVCVSVCVCFCMPDYVCEESVSVYLSFVCVCVSGWRVCVSVALSLSC